MENNLTINPSAGKAEKLARRIDIGNGAILCCLAINCGLVGIVFDAQVNSKYDAGDYDGAAKSAKEAAKWTKIGFFCGIAFIILYVADNILRSVVQQYGARRRLVDN